MGPCNHQDLFPAKEFIVQQLRQRTEWNAPVEDMLEFYVSAGDGIADYYQVRLRIQVLGGEGPLPECGASTRP